MSAFPIGIRVQSSLRTSNDLRNKLSAPFVSRHIFSSFATPSLVKELEILRARCPKASSIQLGLAIKLLDGVRGIAGFEDYPSLRESIDVVGAFQRDAINDLDENSILRYFCYFVKTAEAQELLRLQLDYLLLTATSFNPQIDFWLAERDANYPVKSSSIGGQITENTSPGSYQYYV